MRAEGDQSPPHLLLNHRLWPDWADGGARGLRRVVPGERRHDATGIPEGQPGAGPLKAGPSLVDFATGHNSAIAILAALNHRNSTGEGQHIDMALLDSSVAMVCHIMQDYLIHGVQPERLGNGGNGGGPADLIHARDGMIYLMAGSDAHWRRMSESMGQPDLYADPRFDTNAKRAKTNRAELIDIINVWSRQFTTEELQAKFDSVGIPAARYNDLAEVWDDPQVQHRGLRATTPHVGPPPDRST